MAYERKPRKEGKKGKLLSWIYGVAAYNGMELTAEKGFFFKELLLIDHIIVADTKY